MSRRLDLAPFAVTSNGAIFVNVAKLTTTTDFEAVVRAAERERRTLFLGVMMSPAEGVFAMARLDNAADEAAARIVGQRRQRRRDRSPKEK